MVKCPICQIEMDAAIINEELSVTGHNSAVIHFDVQYRCQEHGEFIHKDQIKEFDLL